MASCRPRGQKNTCSLCLPHMTAMTSGPRFGVLVKCFGEGIGGGRGLWCFSLGCVLRPGCLRFGGFALCAGCRAEGGRRLCLWLCPSDGAVCVCVRVAMVLSCLPSARVRLWLKADGLPLFGSRLDRSVRWVPPRPSAVVVSRLGWFCLACSWGCAIAWIISLSTRIISLVLTCE